MKTLRWTLCLQVLFFSGWGASLLLSHEGAPEVFLETRPVDPRDLLSGHFVALSYPIAAPEAAGCDAAEPSGRMVFVRLEPSGRSVRAQGRDLELWSATRCGPRPAGDSGSGVWVKGLLEHARGRKEIRFGIERFFVTEDSPLRESRSGSVVARVAVGGGGRLRIKSLLALDRP